MSTSIPVLPLPRTSTVEDEECGKGGFEAVTTAEAPILNDVNEEERKVIVDLVHAVENEYTEEQYKKLLWKQDRILMPIMWILYGLQQADKTSISTQATFGMREDTNLVGQQFAWLSTIFYLAYMAAEAPGNYMMQRINVGKTLGVLAFSWGIIVFSIAFAHSWAHLMILRTLQGILESTISPAYLLLTASWYTTREHPFRSVIWGTSNAGMAMICDASAYGIATTPTPLAPWRGISFYLGSLTMVMGVVTFVMLGTPREVWWLSANEKRMAAARVSKNGVGTDRLKHAEWKWDQVRQAALDPQTWIIVFLVIANTIPNGGVSIFGNLVLTSMGFTPEDTLRYGTIPRSALSIPWFLFIGWVSLKRRGWRMYCMMISVLPAFAGMMVCALLPRDDAHLWGRWGGFFITSLGNVVGLLIWTFVPSNVAGRTKKTIVLTALFVSYCTGNAVGAQVFRAKWAPEYIPALIITAIFYAVELVAIIVWRWWYVCENARRAKIIAAMKLTPAEIERRRIANAEADMTDRENLYFVYDY